MDGHKFENLNCCNEFFFYCLAGKHDIIKIKNNNKFEVFKNLKKWLKVWRIQKLKNVRSVKKFKSSKNYKN